MSDKQLPKSFDDLSQAERVQWIMEGFRRTLIHSGCWFRETEYQLGMEKAAEVEAVAGDLSWKPFFASGSDVRIRTECVACPPGEHSAEWFCA